ncbi:MAG TPA: magnesium transporter CorA family protein [Gammaproteobacteria bacterium]|jgi:magnesium/cobalt transport protein CorA|nr:magnesium transporter CorA family protein [Gammaproteobacteria bacterium]
MDTNSTIIEFDIGNKTSKEITASQFTGINDDPNKITWIHCNSHDQELLQKISGILQLPENINELLHDTSRIPRVEDTESSLTLKISSPLDILPHDKIHLEFTSLILYLTSHYCLTISGKTTPALKEFYEQRDKSLRFAKTPCFIAFIILDNILNDYSRIIFSFETLCDSLESQTRRAHKSHYRDVMRVKKFVIRTKRNISSIRDILMRISGRKISVVSEQCRKSLLDAYTHSQAIVSETDSLRDLLNSILDQIDNSLMHKMSETMTVLTAYATIIMPPTLIASIYGMNFVNMPELHWHYGYYYALGLMAGIALFLYYLFKRRKWF